MGFTDTTIMNRNCVFIVIGTRMNTENGKIQKQMHEPVLEESDTSLKKRLDELETS